VPSSRLLSSSKEEEEQKEEQSTATIPTVTADVVQGPNLLRTPVSRPSPSLMVLPGLRSLPFWSSPDHTRIAYGDPVVTSVVQHLEQHVEVIRNEYLKVAPDLKSDYESTGHSDSLHQGHWEWHSYLNKGSVQGHFARYFPETTKILQELRNDDHLLFEGTPFGFCFFSTLGANASIQAHTAPMNLRLRIHLPLIVPSSPSPLETNTNEENDELPACGIRVGPLVRPWIQDKALVLDDSYDHEVWNRTDQTRVVLLVDIWHPDISPLEKQEIVKMFQDARQQGLWKR
jgi:hypothetical protein